MKLSTTLSFTGIILIMSLFCIGSIQAANEKYSDYAEGDLTGKQIHLTDPQFSKMNEGNFPFKNEKVNGRIILSVDPVKKTLQKDYTATVVVSGSYYAYENGQFVSHPISTTLQVNYKADGSAYTDKSIFMLAGAHKIDLTVVSSTIAPEGPANLKLEAEIEITRFYDLDLSLTPANLDHKDLLMQSGEIEFSWDAVPNAESYDLEWVFVTDYGPSKEALAPDQIEVEKNLFKNNSTRVTINQTHYKIPYIYDRGYILYRVRAIGRSSKNKYAGTLEGAWTFDPQLIDCNTVACFPNRFFSGSYAHQNYLNWQFTASYAEDGKSKVVMNYFDGIFRDRQTLTRLNTINKTLVGEKIYDFQNRPAIQILPVPSSNNSLDYKPAFNQNLNSLPYSADDFDKDRTGCISNATPMGTQSGASRYYSSDNDDKTGANAYIPDAQGYPFIQTEYTPDNTGRVKALTMPGPVHQLPGSIAARGQEHVTRNYYGTPNKEDLDALFGSEAGDASHYKKNMVKDPNGQMSVTYLDPAGHTIATSLAGPAPDNLLPLENNTSTTVNVDMLNKKDDSDKRGSSNILNLEDMTVVLEKKITIPVKQSLAFDYQLMAEQFTNDCSNQITMPNGEVITKAATRCYNCVYDLSASLTDNCGNEYLTGINPAPDKPKVLGEDILNAIDQGNPVNCTDFQKPDYSNNTLKTTDLEPGEYTLKKVLKVNKKALDYYTQQYFKDNSCLLDQDYFKTNEYAQADFSGCITCEDCKRITGEYDKFNILKNPDCDPCLTQKQYDDIITQCEDIYCKQDKSTVCNAAYQAMLSDMSPGGQYAEYREGNRFVDGVMVDAEDDKYTPEKFPLSIFNESNYLPQRKDVRSNWRFPSGGSYKEEDGSPSLIPVVKNEDGTFQPAVLKEADVLDGMTAPTNLAKLEDFILNWRPSWAQSLVYYHPEYPLYELCSTLGESHDFDYDWMNKKFTEISADWKKIGTEFNFESFDPFFRLIQASPTPDQGADDAMRTIFKNMMRKAMVNYTVGKDGTVISIWQAWWKTVHGSLDNPCNPEQAMPTAIENENQWNIFKSMYNGLKMKFVQKYITYRSMKEGYYNGCIGDKKFTASKDGFNRVRYSVTSISWLPKFFRRTKSQFYNYVQPCNYRSYKYYLDKKARFEAYNDVLQFEFLQNNECDVTIQADGITADGISMEEPICTSANDAALKEAENISDLAIYKTCGQCPLARDIQELLKKLTKNKKLTTTEPLSCTYPEFTEDLRNATGGTDQEMISWTVTKYIAMSELEAKIKNISFRLKLPNGCRYDFNDFTNLCCLTYQPKPVMVPFKENSNFTLVATVVIKPDDPDYKSEMPGKTKEIPLEGYSGIDIKNCTFDPVCKPTQDALDIMGLLNALAFNDPEITTPSLTSTTPVSLVAQDENPRSVLYSTALTDNLKSVLDENIGASIRNTNWHWVATSVSGGKLMGRIQDGTSPTGGECDIVLFGLPSDLSYSNIYSFGNIKPYSGDDFDFTITALFKTKDAQGNVTNRYAHLTGLISYFTMGTCETALPDEWDMAGGKTPRANTGYYYCAQSATSAKMVEFLNDPARNWATYTDKDYVLIDYPDKDSKIEIWMPPLSGNFFSDVDHFSDLEPDQRKLGDNYWTRYFIAVANMKNGTRVQVSGYCPGISMGNCFPKVNLGCPATNVVQIIMEELNKKADAGLITSSQVIINYIGKEDTVNINFNNGFGALYTDIQSFSHIIPNNEYLNADGSSKQFYVIAHMKNGEINQMVGSISDTIIISSCFSGNKELVKNGNFDKIINYPGFPENVCSANPKTSCIPSSKLLTQLEFQTEHNYKFSWGHYSGDDNYNSFRVIPQNYTFLPSYSGNGLVIDGNPYKSTKNYTIDWMQEITVDPYTDYDFSCLLSNLEDHGPAQLDVVIFDDDTHSTYTSIFKNGASVQIGKDKPYTLTTTGGITITKGFDYERRKTGARGEEIDWRVWYKVKKHFNSEGRTKLILAIIDYNFNGMGNDILIDNISMKETRYINEQSGYDESKDFLCNLPDVENRITPPTEKQVKETSCLGTLQNIAAHNAQIKYDLYKEEQRINFREEYVKKCLDVYEKLLMSYSTGEYQYTLYYYDQAGNLVRTVPPAGVNKLMGDALTQANTDRINDTKTVFTDHTLVSTYRYNSLNQLTAQSSPDMEDLNMKEMGEASAGIPQNYTLKGMSFTSASNGYAIASDGSNGHFYTTADAGKTWSEVTGLGVGDILAVRYVPGNGIFAIGERGLILKSTDQGSTWMQKTMDSQGTLLGIYFSSATNGLIMEQNGRIWTTEDGGETWLGPQDRLVRLIDGQVKDMAFSSTSNGFVVASSGKIYKTTDGGVTWSNQSTFRAGNLSDVTYWNGNAYAAGENGLILKRILGGNWEKMAVSSVGNISRIHLSGDNNILILTSDKKLWYSKDKGKTWQQKTGSFKSFAFNSPQNGYAFTSDGFVYATFNGGQSWSKLPGGLPPVTVTGFYSFDDILYMVGSGSLYKNMDNGSTWKEVTTNDIDGQIKDLYIKNTYAYALTTDGTLYTSSSINGEYTLWNKATTAEEENSEFASMSWSTDQSGNIHGMLIKPSGKIVHTSDGGANWSVNELTGMTGTLQGISMNSKDIATVFGAAGETWTTTNAGVNWTNESNQLQVPSLNSIACVDKDNCFAAGNNGVVLKTSNAGTLWYLQSTGTSQNLNAISMYSNTKGMAVGDNGTIAMYNDTWSLVTPTTTNTFYDVIHTGSSEGMAVGALSTVAGGSGWSLKTIPSSLESLKAVSADPDNSSQMIAVGQKGKLYKSTDGGSNWTMVNAMAPAVLNATFMVNSLKGYAVGNAGEVYQTSDGGSSWKRLSTAGTQDLTGVCFTDDSHGLVIGVGGIAYSTVNAGESWTSVTTNSASRLTTITFATPQAGFITTEDSKLLTTKTGMNGPWTVQSPSATYTGPYNKVFFPSANVGFLAGNGGLLLKTTDQGSTWSVVPQNISTDDITDVHFIDNKIGYVITRGGTLIKTLTGGDTWENQNAPANHPFNFMAAAEGNNFYIAGGSGILKVTDFSDLYSSQFYYDRLGRLVVSQNAKQYNSNHTKYSYTVYDEQNRITEVGEVVALQPVSSLYENGLMNHDRFLQWVSEGTRKEVTHTYYDEPMSNQISGKFGTEGQQNLRNRVASVTYEDADDGDVNTYSHATHYSYDVHGNVKTLIQDNPALAAYNCQDVVISYEYDLISNKVNLVKYQEGKPDQFFHKYEYDDDNRITRVFTSRDNAIWEEDASYAYYDHGPLARTEIGDNKVQGVDYAYTIQGWLKGINSSTLNTSRDMGKDGNPDENNLNAGIPKDLMGYTLGYYQGDYKAIGSSGAGLFAASTTNAGFATDAKYNLYNGNISHTVSAIGEFMKTAGSSPQVMAYQYDQLNRLIRSDEFTDNAVASTNSWTTVTPTGHYGMQLEYDGNGNIRNLSRKKGDGQELDHLQYTYENIGNGYLKNTNKLRSVFDNVTSTKENYEYDESGNLIKNDKEEIANIEWTVSGKIKRIIRTENSKYPDLEYDYDASGNRILKIEKPRSGGTLLPETDWTYTYYQHDAQGNVMGTYERLAGEKNFRVKDLSIYGSSRIGLLTLNEPLTVQSNELYSLTAGKKYYELSNHLGNVLNVFTNISKPEDTNKDGIIDSYTAMLVSANDYYPFGMLMPERSVSSNEYRYGFNGKEKDNEVTGSGRTYDYGFRIYDARIARFLSMDPLTKEYPWYTPYQFAGNKPIMFVDLDGQEESLDWMRKFMSGFSNQLLANAKGIQRAAEFTGKLVQAKSICVTGDCQLTEEQKVVSYLVSHPSEMAKLAVKVIVETGRDLEGFGKELKNGNPEALGQLAAELVLLAMPMDEPGKAASIEGRIAANILDNTVMSEGNVITMVVVKELRWTQRTAGGRGRAAIVRDRIAKNGYQEDPIDVVITSDGLVTLDHTRAAVALENGIEKIPAKIHSPSEALPDEMIKEKRFGNSKTWGEAMEYRAGTQVPPLPPTGTTKPPKLPKKK